LAVTVLVAVSTLLGTGATASAKALIGLLPPRVPATNCTSGAGRRSALAQIDYCRSIEGVGPLVLPANFSRLTVPERLLTLINLERMNRGLTPVIGLNRTLDTYAQQGAGAGTDPTFPSSDARVPEATPRVYHSGGSIWAENSSVLGADLSWMYQDGAGAGNGACLSPGDAGCWGHRGIILSDAKSATLVGGGGYAASTGGSAFGHSYAFEQLYGFSTALVYRWTSEVPFFASAPGVEPEEIPTVASVIPTQLRASGGRTVTLTGTNLIGTTAVSFGTARASDVFCVSESRCTVRAPAHASGTVRLTARDGAGSSGRGPVVRYATA
jgi:hypothetical protein